ncbi:MAG: 2-phospho-L-lactate transferase CofD family protein, partial [Actinomycetota bacterium]
MITVLAGGVGAARFLRGLVNIAEPEMITAVVNTGDDSLINGLRVSPDLDTVTYTVAGAIDAKRGWGLGDESWRVMESLGRYVSVRPEISVAANTWFNLGDRDLATHLYRTARLGEGATLTEVTDEIRRAWGLRIGLVP